MKAIIWSAVLGLGVLAGCQTGGAVATRNSPAVIGDQVQSMGNPHSLERGLLIRGTVDKDFEDMLVMEDQWGQTRYLRISSETRYFQDGKQVGREFLVPGATVRASFDDNNKETIAREIHIVSDTGVEAPVQLPERPNSIIP